MLGRPTHRLDAFGDTLAHRIEGVFDAHAERRQGVALTIRRVSFRSDAGALSTLPWRYERLDEGEIGIHVDRAVLLALLEQRYGPAVMPVAVAPSTAENPTDPADAHDPAPLPATPLDDLPAPDSPPAPATSTEQRLAQRFARDLALACARSIPSARAPDESAPPDASRPRLFVMCDVADAARRELGQIALALDDAWQRRLFDHLATSMRRTTPAGCQDAPLATRLRLKLTAQLIDVEVPFGDVLRLRAGCLLPVRLHSPARVLVAGARLFSATISEHDGKLCLNDFDAME
ncbi:FliMN_C domain-containing protein [Burkholderia diffusa]|uniref:FliM/FliN family flagellar motor switch protein n=1 Tax=Burkholderia diffusa TaxID=488732 RepID=UPI001CB63C38|nr:FliM/FliN family flagellar motor C-terminal domain-containing protein [Burkholderia diffusa]CAG9246897.1 FliMN_C domain-containing protein [Burkholderia diffusa]